MSDSALSIAAYGASNLGSLFALRSVADSQAGSARGSAEAVSPSHAFAGGAKLAAPVKFEEGKTGVSRMRF